MSIIIVDTTASLREAVNNATGNDIIQIESGDYGRVNISKKSHLVLQAKDINNRPTIERINIFESNNIDLLHLNLGEKTLSTDPNNQSIAVNASFSSQLRFLNLDIKNVHDAIAVRHSQQIEISGNTIHSIRRDGLSILDVDNILVKNNLFTEFHPNYEEFLYKDWYFDAAGTAYLPDKVTLSDHADFIQITDSRIISIISNTLDATGGAWTQSIFISGGHYNEPVTITNNIINNGHIFGIKVVNQDNVIQSNNKLSQIETLGIEGLQAQYSPTINIEQYEHNDVWTIHGGERRLVDTKTEVIPPTQITEVTTNPIETDANHINYFLLSIDTAQSTNVSIQYETRDGTALAGQDYIATSGTATLLAGELSIAIAVTIIGDQIAESDETFSLVAMQAQGASFLDNSNSLIVSHTIIDDDAASMRLIGVTEIEL
jgi:hypothetical protein